MVNEAIYGTFFLFSGKKRPIFVASYLMMAIVNFNVRAQAEVSVHQDSRERHGRTKKDGNRDAPHDSGLPLLAAGMHRHSRNP